MAIVKTYDLNAFIDELAKDKYNNYSSEAASAIFEYLNELEDNIELDIVAIRCTFSEYSVEDTLSELGDDYDSYFYDIDDKTIDEMAEALEDKLACQVILLEDSLLVIE